MKLVRFGAVGSEKPGLVDRDGKVRDLSAHAADISGETLGAESLARLRSIDAASLPLAPEGVRLGAPVSRPWSFVAVGLNYADHARETGQEIPSEPILFNKLGNTVSGPFDDVIYPKGADRMDWELEIAFVIGKRARYVEEKDAMSYVAGYCICNDVSERRFQMKRNGQWVKGKACETFGPLGPWLVTTDEITDPHNLSMELKVNGETRQKGSTSTMIFSVPYLVSYITQFCVLEPGDVVTTGTPPGVGSGMKPPQYLKAGDVMELSIEGLGLQRQTVVPFTG
ncbi:MAG: fumarylacetoacetate hydrolase family protein [Hyphomicrobium sp.]|jgi:2-keto-4-pentenoate hydratase/2-oxohepta-3-ene-1,7-dioic acid hydratase in catechol pathway